MEVVIAIGLGMFIIITGVIALWRFQQDSKKK